MAVNTKRLKYAVQLRSTRIDGAGDDRPYVGLEQIESKTGKLLGYAIVKDTEKEAGTLGESLCSVFEPGDVLFGKLRPYLAKTWVADFSGRCTTELLVFQPKDFESRFLRSVCLSNDFNDAVDASTFGSKMPRADWDFIGNLRVPVPSINEQRAIADHLDRETARIDTLVAAKERVLALMAEKRRALITQAVTRGLNPNAPLRDSGIPWLGKIPKGWETLRLRFLIENIEQGWSPEAENREPAIDEWGVLKLSAIHQGRFDETASKALPLSIEPRNELEIRGGDFLLTRSNTPKLVGDVCFVETTRPRLMLSDLIYRLALNSIRIDGRFLCHFLTIPVGRGQIESDARGTSASMVKISQEHIKDWLIPVPPLVEQRAIVAHIAAETGKLDALRAATESTITLLKERRAALIAAAVTGQIDYEGVA